MESIRLYYGFDPREAVGAHVFLQSILDRCSLPVEAVALTPALGKSLGIEPEGTNSFGKLRFAVPHLMGYQGFAIFADGADMLLRADLAELWALRDPFKAVQVVKHDYQTKHARKYIGTELEADNRDYPRKNWSSLVIWNCGSFRNRLKPQGINDTPATALHRFGWLADEQIGELPECWNHLIGESVESPEAKLHHHTLGIPGFAHYAHCEGSREWKESLRSANRGI
jgi:hypothetical protein